MVNYGSSKRKPMTSAALMAVALYLNGAANSGKYDDISIEIVKQHIEAGTIFDFLKDKLGRDVDLTHLNEREKCILLEEWQDKAIAINEARKMCVDRGGLCLLVAYLLGQIREEAKAEGILEGRLKR